MTVGSSNIPGNSAAVPSAPSTANEPRDLIQSCQGLVRSLAWKLKERLPPQVDVDDLIGYGQVGLVQAAQDFDPNRRRQFTTFAYYRIRGSILDGLSQMAWFSRADLHRVNYERLSGEVLGEEERAGSTVDATISLAREAGWFADLVSRLSVVYLTTWAGDCNSRPFVDANESPPAQAMAHEMRERLKEMVLALPAEARALIQATYYEGVTLQEAGRRLGISKAWASRLHARAVASLSRSFMRASHARG
jgi:RNA polymerase sigma factor for flagellar operon FliA